MASRAPPVKRVFRPLTPIASVLTVVDDALVEIHPANVTADAVG